MAEVLEAILDHKDKVCGLRDRITESWKEPRCLRTMEPPQEPQTAYLQISFTWRRNRPLSFFYGIIFVSCQIQTAKDQEERLTHGMVRTTLPSLYQLLLENCAQSHCEITSTPSFFACPI